MKRYRPPVGLSPYEALIHRGFTRRGDCILSLCTPHSGGYRYIQRDRKNLYVHRISFEHWHRPLLEAEQVDHVCHNWAALRGECSGGACFHRSCVNPAHLEAVTQAENLTRSPLFREGLRWRNRITRCPRGHEYTEENTRIYRGSRNCRACAREKMGERRAMTKMLLKGKP